MLPLTYLNYSPLTFRHYKHQYSTLLSRLLNTQAQDENTHPHTLFHLSCGPQLLHVTEKQFFSTSLVGHLPAHLLMASIWGSHWFPVALIKSRLIKTFAIHPLLTLVFIALFSFRFEYLTPLSKKQLLCLLRQIIYLLITNVNVSLFCFKHSAAVLTFPFKISLFNKSGMILVNKANFVDF